MNFADIVMFNINKNSPEKIAKMISKGRNVSEIVDELPDKVLTFEVVESAIKSGYVFSNATPDIIKNNREYVKLAISYHTGLKIEGKSAINYCNTNLLDSELVKFALDNKYMIDKDTPTVISDNLEYIEYAFNVAGHLSVDTVALYFIKTNNELIKDEAIVKLFTECNTQDCINKLGMYHRCNKFSIENLDLLNRFLDIAYKYSKDTYIDKIVLMATANTFDDNTMYKAIDYGYVFDENIPEFIKWNSDYIRYLVNKAVNDNNSKALYSIDYMLETSMEDDIILNVCKNGYSLNPNTPDFLRNDPKVIEYLIEYGTPEVVTYTVNHCNQDLLNLQLLADSLKRGYNPLLINELCNDLVATNINLVKSAIENLGISYLIDFVDESILTDELVSLAISKGYSLSDDTREEILSNQNYINLILENSKNGNNIDYLEDDFVTDELIEKAVSLNYQLCDNTSKKVWDYIINSEAAINKVLESSQEFGVYAILKYLFIHNKLKILNIDVLSNIFIKYKSLIPKLLMNINYYHSVNRIFKESNKKLINKNRVYDKICEKLGVHIAYIFKDSILLDTLVADKLKYKNVIEIIKNSYLKGIDLDLNDYSNKRFVRIIDLYLELTNDTIDDMNIKLFINFINKSNRYDSLLSDLLKNDKYEKVTNKLRRLMLSNYDLNINSIEELVNIDNAIYIKNQEYINIEDIRNNICLLLTDINYSEYTKIKTLISLEKISELAKTSQDVMFYNKLFILLDYIDSIEDINILSDILNCINEYFINNVSDFNRFKDSINISYIINKLYRNDLSMHENDNDILYQSKKYKVGEDEYNSYKLMTINKDVNFMKHVMYEFGNNSVAEAFITDKILERTYIKLTKYNKNNKFKKIKDKNHVVLLYNNVDFNNLIIMDDCVLAYNIKPVGILLSGDKACKAELDCASQLKLPLIMISKED